MAKILVTGGLGVVGNRLYDYLKSQGHLVKRLDLYHHHDPDYFRCDIRSYRQLERAMCDHKFDYVYNLAAEFGRWNGEDFYENLWLTNAIGTKNIIRLQEKLGFHLIHASSSEVYGDYTGVMKEDVMDNYPIKQMNDYAITKWINELQILNSALEKNTKTVRIRIFNTYGPGEYFSEYRSVVCRFVYYALHDMPYTVYLNHTRTHTYIDDAVIWIGRICDNFKSGEVYNIAGSHRTDIKQISNEILKYLKKTDNRVTYKESEPMTTKDKIVDNKKMLKDLGSLKETSFEQGIANTIEWMKEVYSV